MKNLKNKFIEFTLDYHVLQFGEFTLKSGRISPYFFNAGLFQNGRVLKELGQFYAELYQTHHLNTQHLFGPAYKGIQLATTTAIALAEKQINTTVTYNRKEAKSHGEKGLLVGAPLEGPTTIIDDVITAGTAFREAQQLIEAHGGSVHSVLIALDRCERGLGQTSTLTDIQAQGISVYAIISLVDIINYLTEHHQVTQASQLEDYQRKYAPK
ncbi:MAG: orotate phosphoribosyltransferase [Gammaproteobacteria bacterium]|nr:orotate phosphoribosyltransferase [Gammaproteobacteria bacterium]